MARQSPSRKRWRSVAQRDVDRAFEHPDLLVHARVAPAGLEGHAPARREVHLDDLHRLRHARRRDVAPTGSPRPGPATAAGRHAAPPGRRAPGPRRPAHRTARPASRPGPRRASPAPPRWGCSRRARSSEIIERLTPLLPASASSERPCAARSSRTRSAMRWFRPDAVSSMMDIMSIMMETPSRRRRRGRRSHRSGGKRRLTHIVLGRNLRHNYWRRA